MILNPVYVVGGGGAGGLHCSKVRSECSDKQNAFPHFYYRPPDGGGEFPIEVINVELPETECQPGSVFLVGVTRELPQAQPTGWEEGVMLSIDGETLVLKATTVNVRSGNTEIT